MVIRYLLLHDPPRLCWLRSDVPLRQLTTQSEDDMISSQETQAVNDIGPTLREHNA